ncbi:MAG TPA: protein kinase [Candidatus Angelobacter sp.]|nr:protein kinase [Candidatus Angelobacter sp.]
MEHAVSSRIQLGEFELNLKTGELYSAGSPRNGRKVLLQEQPYNLLLLLIENQGEIVTRQEIRRKLWPKATAGDFDHGINVAITALRQALSDSAEKPRYIETMGHGYRLLVTTNWLDDPSTPPGIEAGNLIKEKLCAEARALVGKNVSHYRVLEVIGGGGMGMVYKAEDIRLGRRVALKFLPEELATDPVSLQRFEREAQTASAMNHPNICTIYGIDEYQGQPFIVMEMLEGNTILHHLAASNEQAIPLPQLLDYAIQICDGLQVAHEKNIIHRDIKPGNLFITKNGPLKILDFGLAKLAETEEIARKNPVKTTEPAPSAIHEVLSGELSVTHASFAAAMGTVGYMSPEQIRKEKLDSRTDLFSFGIVLYEMVTRQRAFIGETVAVVHDAILNRGPAPINDLNSTIPRRLNAVISKALEKDRTLRYQSASEMRADLERVQREINPVRRRIHKWVAAAAVLLAAAAVIWAYNSYRNRVTLSANDSLVLADMSNQTSDPLFDDAFYDALHVAFEQTPYLNVLASDKVRGTLKLLNLPENTRVTANIARDICRRTGSKMLVAPAIDDVGNQFRIDMSAIDCRSAYTIAQVRLDAPSRNEIVHFLGMASARLRRKLGEPADSITQFNTPLEEATSSSPEALHFLRLGYQHHIEGKLHEAAANYEHAIEVDPNLALAYASLGVIHHDYDETSQSATAEKQAYNLRTRLSWPTRFQVETIYHLLVDGDLETPYPVFQQWVQTFPRNAIAHTNFAWDLMTIGQYDRALVEARTGTHLLPTHSAFVNWMGASIYTDRPAEAMTVFDEALAHKFDSPQIRELRATLAFLQKDERTLQEQWSWGATHPGGYELLFVQARIEAYHGRFHNAQRLVRQAIDMADKAGDSPRGSHYLGQEILQDMAAGDLATGKQLLAKVSQRSRARYMRMTLALALAYTGDREQVQKVIDTANHELPLDTTVQNYCLPVIRAAIQLEQHNPASAIDLLRPAEKYELAKPAAFDGLYPAYIRGQAYLQMGKGRLAEAEFRKILDHPGLVGTYITGALAYLELARAQKMAGDESAARASYADFLALWKDADPRIPVYRQAKAEYAVLREK